MYYQILLVIFIMSHLSIYAQSYSYSSLMKTKFKADTIYNLTIDLNLLDNNYNLPDNIYDLKNLKSLSIFGGTILINRKLLLLSKLQSIRLEGFVESSDSTTWDIISSLNSLKELKIVQNEGFLDYPNQLLNLDSLNHIAICWINDSFNWNSEMFKLTKYKELETLILGPYNTFKCFPAAVLKLPKLKNLDFSNSNIKNIPSNINQLRLLECLILENTQIDVLPPEIGDLSRLKLLNISGTKLQNIPKEVVDLKSLEILNISHIIINELPDDFKKLSSLKQLYISPNLENNKKIKEFINTNIECEIIIMSN